MTKSDAMQAKNTNYDVFFGIVDEIVQHTGCSTTDLTEMIGISRQTFYAYKNREKPISNKSITLAELALKRAKCADSKGAIVKYDEITGNDVERLISIRNEISQAFVEISNRLTNIDRILKDKNFTR